MKTTEILSKILGELKVSSLQIDETQVAQFVSYIGPNKLIYVAGAGRSGVAIKAFASRLMHLGLDVHFIGDITVKVIVDSAEVLTKTFTYYSPTQKQQQTVPIQQRVQIQEAGECELQLRHFSNELKDNPNDPYIKFMLNKWGKRCSGE